MDPARVNAAVTAYDPSQYILTAHSANKVSRQAKIAGPSNIMLGGKVIIHHAAVVRGDLVRTLRTTTGPSTAPDQGTAVAAVVDRIVISTGKYCVIGHGAVLRPPWRVYKGAFSYYPSKTGDFVHIGANSVVESSQVGNAVDIGNDCVLGRSSIIKDCVRLLPHSVLPPNATIPSGQVWGGNPAKFIAELPENWLEMQEERCRDYYARFRPLPSSVSTTARTKLPTARKE